jgi:hypothetical protein
MSDRNLPADVRVHVQVPAAMYEALRKINAESGCPVTEIIRRAVQSRIDLLMPSVNRAIEARIVGSPAPGREPR